MANFLYYCSIADVKDALVQVRFFDEDNFSKMPDTRIRRLISRAYGRLNAALKTGGYNVPVTNSVTTSHAADVTGDPDFPVTVAVTTGDGSAFSPGDTVRFHGSDGLAYQDEFTGVVAVSGDTLTLEAVANTFVAAGGTIELCTQGYLYIRDCLAKGAAFMVLSALTVGQARSSNEQIDSLQEEWQACLTELKDTVIRLDGLGTSATAILKTRQTENSTDASADPTITRDMAF